MRELKALNGYKYIAMTIKESEYFQWGNICDQCGRNLGIVRFYIPVLNYGVCGHCLTKWEEKTHYYEEDVPFETFNLMKVKYSAKHYEVMPEVMKEIHVENTPQSIRRRTI